MLHSGRLLRKVKKAIGVTVASSSLIACSIHVSEAGLFDFCRRRRVTSSQVFVDYPPQNSRLYGYMSSYFGGAYVTYKLDEVTGILYISKTGDGDMVITQNWQQKINRNLVKSVRIGDGFTIIDIRSFEGCVNLESVTMPNSLRKIANWVFSDCISLVKINDNNKIPNSVNFIGKGAFHNCRSLNIIVLPEHCKVYGGAFCGCISLNFVNRIQNFNTYIDYDAFLECHNLITYGEFRREFHYWWAD